MKEMKIKIPAGCEVDIIEMQDGAAVITFKEKERKLPKSLEEFCEMYPRKEKEAFITSDSCIEVSGIERKFKLENQDKNNLPDRDTAEAVLALCKLIQLRNAYNGGWVPDWFDYHQTKYVINFVEKGIVMGDRTTCGELLYFENRELRDEFLRNFQPLIEKLKPLYGIKIESNQ